MSAKPDIWDQFEGMPSQRAPQGKVPSSPADYVTKQEDPGQITEGGDAWSQFEGLPEEGLAKKATRYAAQPVIGALSVTTPGLIAGGWEMLGTGEALAEMQDWEYGNKEEELRKKFPSAPWTEKKVFDKDRYLQALDTASKTIPTVENISSFLEKNTGLPLEARNEAQKLLRLAGAGGKLRPGGVGSKTFGAVVAPVISGTAQAVGVPEPVADILGLGVSTATPRPTAKKVTKPSGLPTRRYEGLKKERKITPKQYTDIKEKVEGDVRSLTDKLIKTESKTARAIEEFPDFNEKINTLFEKVSDISEKMPDNIPTGSVRRAYRKKINARETKGISPDEFERAYLKEAKSLHKSIPDYKNATVKEMVEQYRKNNKSLGELFEPGKSGAANRAKREALLDYNGAIANIFEERFPDSEFNKLFKFTNKRHVERMDLDRIDTFMDKIFGDKINYNETKKFFTNPRTKQSFERTLGKDGYSQMKGIMNDFISTEQSNKLLKQATAIGFKDMAKLGAKWILNPIWGKSSAIAQLGNVARNNLLKNSKFRIKWKSALDDFKAKKFAKAEKGFKELEGMTKTTPKTTSQKTSTQ